MPSPPSVEPLSDETLVSFLRWCLPQLGLRWDGYRKVRRLVGKRLRRRVGELGLPDIQAYRAFLLRQPEEWCALDALCRIPISRFCRDRRVFDAIGDTCLALSAAAATDRGDTRVRCWSAGCASGEEPYTLAMLWRYRVARFWPSIRLELLATDAESHMIARAETACYSRGSLKELPSKWVESAFVLSADLLCLAPELRQGVTFAVQDIRQGMPEGPFDLILCRNVAFTYFDAPLQSRIADELQKRLRAHGFLVIGTHERLPPGAMRLQRVARAMPIYRCE